MGSNSIANSLLLSDMKKYIKFITLFFVFTLTALSQSEKVEINNSVYDFLNRLYIKGIIKNYSNTLLPLSRRKIVDYLQILNKQPEKLNEMELKKLQDINTEFEYDLFMTDSNKIELFGKGNFLNNFEKVFSEKEKYLYSYTDSLNTFFADAIFETKSIIAGGDVFDNKNSSLLRWGGRARGTINKHLGYYILATNGQVIGDKDLALTDPALTNNYKIHEGKSTNFDFTEGYISYDADFYSLQLGREKVSVGNGYKEKMIISPVNAMDFVKFEVNFGKINYTFMHNWILSKETMLYDNLTGDKAQFDSKYLATHRLGLSLLESNLELGFSEMIIYSNRPVEIAYMTPLIFYKSVEHSLQDRDNALITFDASVRPINKLKLYGTFIIDELDFSKIGTNWWGNLFSYQVGAFVAEPLNIENFDFCCEYIKILPYTFSHRFIENNYTNYNSFIGANMNPNSDKLWLNGKYYLDNRLNFQLGLGFERHGKNITDQDGNVIRNVGGDINLGHRSIDSENSKFLDGNKENTFSVETGVKYEIFNEFYLELSYLHYSKEDVIKTKQNMINFTISINY
jgi:hypothetical protein